tara:strand:- start:2846 stop:3406 length:561 start_codon:yes stop_codon:yes gene_type:complete
MWRRKDSNLRSRTTTDLQSVPFGHSGTPPISFFKETSKTKKLKAGNRGRTCDLLITNQLLYQLSYASITSTRKTHLFLNEASNALKVSFVTLRRWTPVISGFDSQSQDFFLKFFFPLKNIVFFYQPQNRSIHRVKLALGSFWGDRLSEGIQDTISVTEDRARDRSPQAFIKTQPHKKGFALHCHFL